MSTPRAAFLFFFPPRFFEQGNCTRACAKTGTADQPLITFVPPEQGGLAGSEGIV